MTAIESAADAISRADAVFIGAGAGIGVDSGLPDFRGNEGFWKAYPPFKDAGLSFIDLANPAWFKTDPALAWGFYGHRLNLYRETIPHAGFEILRRWCDSASNDGFVFTSNVDGQFQKAGFALEKVVECHGSIHHFQCTQPCGDDIWEGTDSVAIDDQFRASVPLPTCPDCAQLARPNILMFGDGRWLPDRSSEQEERLSSWLQKVSGGSVVVIELGAGSAVPTVRYQCEHISRALNCPLIRINPRESEGPDGTISIAEGAKIALEQIDSILL